MAVSSFSLSLASGILYHKVSSNNRIRCSNISSLPDQRYCDRRSLMMAGGMLASSFISPKTAKTQEVPLSYRAFIDKADGYSYVYPSDWRDFEFRATDSAFKDRYLQLQNVQLSFLPSDKQDIHDLGPMEDVVRDLVKNIYAAPNQAAYIKEMQEVTTTTTTTITLYEQALDLQTVALDLTQFFWKMKNRLLLPNSVWIC
ncbi:photosynthetic NDH subunit of lumenal location 1, chloroplastic-like [Silene latifolia]|uniref:photosynthetic NDH subunit of lumenal location 1, chloroplastic-like n=1 Tax=Silene latifolia TaxID=37657 RepID=UPI003D785FDE